MLLINLVNVKVSVNVKKTANDTASVLTIPFGCKSAAFNQSTLYICKMKIGILTIPFNNNYGGFLQAFALTTGKRPF